MMRLYEWYIEEYYIYLVFELCDGGGLYQKLAGIKRIDQRVIASIVKQILGVLNYYSVRSYWLRDLNPSYICFQSKEPDDFTIKVANFQLEKLLRECLIAPPQVKQDIVDYYY